MGDLNEKKGGANVLLAVLTGAGLAAAAIVIAKRMKGTKMGSTFDSVMDSCDRAAQSLEDRIQQVGAALAG